MDENASTFSSLVAGLLDTQQTGPGGGSLDQDDSGVDPIERQTKEDPPKSDHIHRLLNHSPLTKPCHRTNWSGLSKKRNRRKNAIYSASGTCHGDWT